MLPLNEYLEKSWDATIRHNTEDQGTLIGLPYPYTVPGLKGAFDEIYYWDTYFTNKGLIECGRTELAKNNCLNMLYLVEKFGYMPNGNRQVYIGGSQPPYLTLMVKDVFDATADKEFLSQAYPTLIKEYAFWMEKRIAPNGLNRHFTDRNDQICREMFEGIFQRIKPVGGENPVAAGKNYYAEAESGWDFTARFSGKCAECNPVDLNCILYATEKVFAEIEVVLGVSDGADWVNTANERKQKINSLLWDDEKKLYLDYNFVTGKRSTVPSAASFWPYFMNLADDDKKIGLENILKILEADYGILTAVKVEDNFQWGYPNVWAPCIFGAVTGLMNYGYKEEALRIAKKYVDLIERNYERTGSLWEKYNAIKGDTDVASEYGTPEMMGWTAGVYLYCENLLK